MNVTMLRQDEVAEQFEVVRPLLAQVCAKAVQGEFTDDDLKRLAEAGRVLLGFATDDKGEVVMAGAFEIVNYPRLRVLNVMALGGRGLVEAVEQQLEMLKGFARHVGARYIQASGSRAMARMLRAYAGFSSVYELVRLPVGDEHVEHQPV